VTAGVGSVFKVAVGAGVGNQVIISNGGMVVTTGSLVSANSVIGGGSGANNNSVVITGPGSVWTNFTGVTTINALEVGAASAFANSLTISDGGALYNDRPLIVGNGAGASNNSFYVGG